MREFNEHFFMDSENDARDYAFCEMFEIKSLRELTVLTNASKF